MLHTYILEREFYKLQEKCLKKTNILLKISALYDQSDYWNVPAQRDRMDEDI